MKRVFLTLCLIASLLLSGACWAQQTGKPGLLSYAPTRIEWLTTVLQAQLRQDFGDGNRFQLLIASPDHETVLIYVRYLPSVNREVMNLAIQGARNVIDVTARGYGWSQWVKIREDVEMAKIGQ
jgi:hypothetical protein